MEYVNYKLALLANECNFHTALYITDRCYTVYLNDETLKMNLHINEDGSIECPTYNQLLDFIEAYHNIAIQIVLNNKKEWTFIITHLTKDIELKYDYVNTKNDVICEAIEKTLNLIKYKLI